VADETITQQNGIPVLAIIDVSSKEIRMAEGTDEGWLLVKQHRKTVVKTATEESVTPLAASATKTGAVVDMDASDYSRFRTAATADEAGTLYIDESVDNVTWVNGVQSIALAADETKTLELQGTAKYVRCRYVKGATPQTTFTLISVASTT
jgi:hypothetical protein